MAYNYPFVVLSIILAFSLYPSKSEKFPDLFQPSWASDHLLYDGELVHLKLDSATGTGFASKSKYLFGKIAAEIKLAAGDSAGTVTAFYMSSDGPTHHEFDFEFLGNSSGEPILLQTNIYVNGIGNREQRIGLWFDPTADFHSYGLIWNKNKVVFVVDDTPIRVYRRKSKKGGDVAFPDDQAMGIYSSIWNADDWATQGGRVKTNWAHAPFVTSFRDFRVEACEVGPTGDEGMRVCGTRGEEREMEQELTVHQSHQLIWVRAHHLVYDYCMDDQRFPDKPHECFA